MIARRLGPRAFAGVASVVISLALVAALAATFFRDSLPPTLDGVDARLRSGQFDDAERQIDAFLKAHPHHDRANLLRAQVALGRADQKPLPALEHLARVQSSAPAVRALVLLNQGKAYSSLGRHEQAESSWVNALRADRLVPEAGWALLGIYYVENRRSDARKLGLALFALEPDSRDRVQILLELLRQDVKPLVAFSVVNVFEPIVRAHPEEKHATIALALALIRDNRPERAFPILERLVASTPDDPGVWEALLIGLSNASRNDELAEAVDRLPPEIAADPRFARFSGFVAKDRGDWKTAVAEHLKARQFDPSDAQVAYRLSRVLRMVDRMDEAAKADEEFRTLNSAGGEALALYDETNGLGRLGVVPRITLFRRLADLRERMGHRDESLAWRRLILSEAPNDPESLAAVAQLADVVMPSLDLILAASKTTRPDH